MIQTSCLVTPKNFTVFTASNTDAYVRIQCQDNIILYCIATSLMAAIIDQTRHESPDFKWTDLQDPQIRLLFKRLPWLLGLDRVVCE